MQLELAFSKSSRPRMRKVLYSMKCALGLTSFHHTPWAFLKIKLKHFTMMEKPGGTSQCIKKFLHIYLLSFALSDTFAGRRRRSCQCFPSFTPRAAQTRLPACKEHCRQKRPSRRTTGHFWVTCSMASSSTPCRRDLFLGVLHEAKTLIHHGIFSHSG